MTRLHVFPKPVRGEQGLDVVVLDQNATVRDLMSALQPYSTDAGITKPHMPNRHGSCAACSVTCCERSLIAPDPELILWMREGQSRDLEAVLGEYLDRTSLEAGVPLLKSLPCHFLAGHLCSIYPQRPAICRLFLCTPVSIELEDLIHAVVARGLATCGLVLWQRGIMAEPGSSTAEVLASTRWFKKDPRYAMEYINSYRKAWEASKNSSEVEAYTEEGGPSFYDVALRSFVENDLWRRVSRARNA